MAAKPVDKNQQISMYIRLGKEEAVLYGKGLPRQYGDKSKRLQEAIDAMSDSEIAALEITPVADSVTTAFRTTNKTKIRLTTLAVNLGVNVRDLINAIVRARLQQPD